MKKLGLATSILALSLAACRPDTATNRQVEATITPTGVTPPATAESTPGRTPLHDPITITLNDAQAAQTLRLVVGDTFVLKLGDEYIWQVEIGDERIVTRAPNSGVKSDARGPYLARAPGQTELQITRDPACSKASPPCAMPSILFQVTIAVR
jgi:hypothetical protein